MSFHASFVGYHQPEMPDHLKLGLSSLFS
ncbi:MAG: cyclic lactone autoinducer peptide [Candidatus Puniceispirillaceae bacterium]